MDTLGIDATPEDIDQMIAEIDQGMYPQTPLINDCCRCFIKMTSRISNHQMETEILILRNLSP